MSYGLLGHDLHETADKARAWFAEEYGAQAFACEEPAFDLPLKPTWQASLRGGYLLCVNVQPSPFSPSLYAFVTQCAQRGLPIRLWVAVGPSAPRDSFGSELKQARELGVGVIQFSDGAPPHEFQRAMALSLFGLARTRLSGIPKSRREALKSAEDSFMDGRPDQGCQSICQELEDVSRRFAELTHHKGWWKAPKGAKLLKARFFTKDSWATLLETMESRANVVAITGKAPTFTKQLVVRTRSFTDWRNEVSHKPKTVQQLKERDRKLRTMFEATRDLLSDWYRIAKPLGLLK